MKLEARSVAPSIVTDPVHRPQEPRNGSVRDCLLRRCRNDAGPVIGLALQALDGGALPGVGDGAQVIHPRIAHSSHKLRTLDAAIRQRDKRNRACRSRFRCTRWWGRPRRRVVPLNAPFGCDTRDRLAERDLRNRELAAVEE